MNKTFSIKKVSTLIFCFIVSVVTIFPFYWTLATSFKKDSELFKMPPTLFPKEPSFEHYITVFNTTKIPTYFINSAFYAISTVVIVLIFACLAAYSISRFKFKGRKTLLIIFLVMQFMPITTLIVPLFVFWGNLKLDDSRFSLISTYIAIAIPTAIWLLTGFMNGIPRELDEAATIDGSNPTGVLFKIIAPLMKPGIVATGLSIFIFVWQDLIIAMTLTKTDELRPLMAGVSTFITRNGIRWGPITAAGIVSLVPILLLYIICQKSMVRGLTAGAVKG